MKAKTPTLIQHGEFDRRVPIANAYELRQGLDDRGVKVLTTFLFLPTPAMLAPPRLARRCLT